ncbi:hypothetical protein [Marinovum sp.]|uniref:hypothetical protein n=1 Tax=Marinovum sp. TaxID=2024839 RepID=UPI002B274FD1|nr:hypothetical protein [Marinovum sp.]
MPKEILIHAGAHRTGTSSFQLCLAVNRVALDAVGCDVAYPGREGAPGGTLRLPLNKAGHDGVLRRLRHHSPDPSRALLLSEENIPGQMFPFLRGQFYPQAEQRLRLMANAIAAAGGQTRRVLLLLRSYDTLFASAYRKRAEDHPVGDFAGRVPGFLAMDRGWVELVQAFRDILAPQELLVADYARRGRSCDLLRRLMPALDGPLGEPTNSVNRSATDAALRHLQARYHAGETLPRAEWQQVIRDFSEDDRDLGVTRYSESEKSVLSGRYSADLERIAGLEGITLLR